MSEDSIKKRNNVQVSGSGNRILMFAHGFGCDQTMWRFLTDRLKNDYALVTFDYVGSGQSDLTAFDSGRYSTLEGYSNDINEILVELDLSNVTLIGHSVSSIIGMLAAIRAPDRIDRLVMVCPSPCYLNDLPDYNGGFERDDLEELIDLMDKNYIGWANYLAPLVMGGRSDPELIQELDSSFCSTDPLAAKAFARATFFSDHRDVIPNCQVPTLVLQSRVDSLAPVMVGRYVHEQLPNSFFRVLDSQGHCIHMTDPALVESEIRAFIARTQEP